MEHRLAYAVFCEGRNGQAFFYKRYLKNHNDETMMVIDVNIMNAKAKKIKLQENCAQNSFIGCGMTI